MLLTIDIGNTSTTIGLFSENKLIETWAVSTDCRRSEDEIGILLINLLSLHNYVNHVSDVSMCSVVVPLTERFKNAIKKYLKITPFVVSNKTANLLVYKVDKPDEVGPDRIVNAFEGYFKYKKNCIIVDFGTATSFDIVSSSGEFLGGIICAGMKIQAESLNKFTSKLPLIKIESSKSIIGKNSIDAILCGIVRGHAKMVEGLIDECKKETGEDTMVIATGGYADIVSQYMTRSFDLINPYFTLEGLHTIWAASLTAQNR